MTRRQRIRCPHCGNVESAWSGRYCYPCWQLPEVRERAARERTAAALREAERKKVAGRKGNGKSIRGYATANTVPLPTKATSAAPGTKAKIAVLAERARLGESLHHTDDASDLSNIEADALSASAKVREGHLQTFRGVRVCRANI